MDKKDKKLSERLFKSICLLTIVGFLTLYLSQATGYFEYNQHRKIAFTSEQIKKFEQDVSEGKNVDIENYLEDANKNYDNKISKLGYNLSKDVSNGVKKAIEEVFKVLNKMVEE